MGRIEQSACHSVSVGFSASCSHARTLLFLTPTCSAISVCDKLPSMRFRCSQSPTVIGLDAVRFRVWHPLELLLKSVLIVLCVIPNSADE